MSSPFETLGVAARFDLDLADLHRRFIQLSAANHPDRFLDALDQADAADRAAKINHAYRVLVDPEARADALLALLGGPAKEADKSLPPDLLATMLETHEEMEAATQSGDVATLARLRDWAVAQRGARLERIGADFAQVFPSAPPGSSETPLSALPATGAERAEVLKAIRLELNALRYFQRMIEQTPSGGGAEPWVATGQPPSPHRPPRLASNLPPLHNGCGFVFGDRCKLRQLICNGGAYMVSDRCSMMIHSARCRVVQLRRGKAFRMESRHFDVEVRHGYRILKAVGLASITDVRT